MRIAVEMTTIREVVPASKAESSDEINYKPLKDSEFRLLVFLPSASGEEPLQCSLKHFSIDDPPPYIALSYTWGSKKRISRILVDGETFKATTNLEDAFRHLRLESGSLLWADAICINQNLESEKKRQLRLMPSIFARAQETRVWLGCEENNSDLAIALIKRMSEFQAGSIARSDLIARHWVSVLGGSAEMLALQHLLVRGYWFRVWVIQEIALSRKVTISCGKHQIPWDSLLNAIEFIFPEDRMKVIEAFYNDCNFATPVGLSPNTFRDGLQRILSIQSVRNDKMMAGDYTDQEPDSLLYLLSSHRPTQATEARDKYFAIAGLCLEDKSILDQTSSTRSIQDVYLLAAKSTAKERRHRPLDFLDLAGWPTDILDLPSWVPDWSYTRDRAIPLLYWQLAGQKHKHMAELNAPGSLDRSVTGSFSFHKELLLSARGFEIDIINGVGFSRWFPRLKTGRSHNAEVLNPEGMPRYGNQTYFVGNEDITEVLWRTCVLNITHGGLEAPADWGNHFYNRLLCRIGLNADHELWCKQNGDFKVHGIELKRIAQTRRQLDLDVRSWLGDAAEQEIASQFFNAFDIAKSYRRLATTNKGYICLAPSTALPGDLIAVLLDCSVPVVLRRKDDHFEFVGTCYVHGIMHGEAMAGLSAQDSVEFEIR